MEVGGKGSSEGGGWESEDGSGGGSTFPRGGGFERGRREYNGDPLALAHLTLVSK